MPAKDITTQRFGRLVALRPTPLRQFKNIIWECQCDCGTLCHVSTKDLRTGNNISCGCAHQEYMVTIYLKRGTSMGRIAACLGQDCSNLYRARLPLLLLLSRWLLLGIFAGGTA